MPMAEEAGASPWSEAVNSQHDAFDLWVVSAASKWVVETVEPKDQQCWLLLEYCRGVA